MHRIGLHCFSLAYLFLLSISSSLGEDKNSSNPSGEDTSPEGLHDLYKKKYANEEKGFYRDGKYLIVISTIKVAKPHSNLTINRAKANVMLESARYLKRYIIETYDPKFKDLPEDSVLAKYPEFKSLIGKNLPGLLEIPLDIKTKGVQLENYFSGEDLRYAYGYVEKDISVKVQPFFDWPTNATLINNSRKWFGSLGTSKPANSKRREVAIEMGSFIEVLISCLDDLSGKYDLSSDWHLRISDSNSIYERFSKVQETTGRGKRNIDNFHQVFNLLPFYPASNQKLLELLKSEGLTNHAFAIQILASKNSAELMEDLSAQKEISLNNQEDKSTNDLSQELYQLISLNSQVTLPSFLEFHFFANSFRKSGLEVISKLHSEKETQEYGDSLNLFKEGGDLSEIQNLVISSIKKSPRHAESWNLLGRTLSLQGYDSMAVPCYHQALFLGAGSIARANLCNAYEKLGLNKLAKGMAFSTLLQKDCAQWETEVACKVLDISP